jgi:hypothetical protein
VELARSSANDAIRAYQIAYDHCVALNQSNATIESTQKAHDDEMTKYSIAKTVLDSAALACDAATQCASGAVTSFGAACGTAAAAGALKICSRALTEVMDEKQKAHDEVMMGLRDDQAVASCFAEADQRQVGFDTANETIQRRITDVEAAVVRLNDLKDRVRQQLMEGRAAIAREQARGVPSISHQFWVDDKVVDFQRQFATAKLLTFLAVKALEYDHQLTASFRADVVSAQHPLALLAVLDRMNNFHIARQIGNAKPGGLNVVLSVRDDLLGLTNDPATGLPTTDDPNFRLRDRLLAPEAAIYNDQGVYVGQGVRFQITPQTHPNFSARCAERVWQVSSSVSGWALSDDSTQVQFELLKRNTFGSKWCPGAGDGSVMQTGRVRSPSYLYGLIPGAPQQSSGDDTAKYTGSTVTGEINLPRPTLEHDQSPPSPTLELAGRGLYGDYILLFRLSSPEDVRTINMQNLEDVLLRFDYESVQVNDVNK